MNELKSPLIVSSQQAPHKNLAKLVRKYQQTFMQDSIPKHAYDAFEIARQFVINDSVILDSGCGTGESSFRLAREFPHLKVLGIDKSISRLQRSHAHGEAPKNLLLLQADCIHLWRLIKQAQWDIHKHNLFYPNPWPKPGHLQRRWHAHPVFPTLLALAGEIVMRTNWKIYAQEFAQAIDMSCSCDAEVKQLMLDTDAAFTAFERKYLHSGHELYEVRVGLREL